MAKNKNESPAATQNPNDASARGLYEAVIAKEGTIDGKPARVALYGTRYAACEIESGGEWTVHQDVGFGGIRGIGQLKQYLDDVAVDPAPVVAVVAEVVAPAVEVVPTAVEPEPVVETAPAAVEPVLTTLDEVRAAFDAETRGACRTSVLRALRVRAGEIALGLPAGGKAEKVKTTADAKRTVSPRTDVRSLVEAAIVASENGSKPISASELATIGFGPSACTQASRWGNGGCGQVAAALGWRTKFSVKSGVTFTRAE